MEPLLDGETQIWSNGLVHMIKMAAMPIYGKKLKKSSSLEPKGRWPWKLVCCIWNSSAIKFVQMMNLLWLDLVHGKVKFGPCFCMEKKVKLWIFTETIVVCDIKVGRCSQLNEYMNLYEYQRSRSFIELGPNHSNSIFLNLISSVAADFNISSAFRWAIQDQWSSGF